MAIKNNLRVYGNRPFKIAVIHGGPGAPGGMAPVACELASDRGVLEPLQTEKSIKGQVCELHYVLKGNGSPPITLIGWSWGAMLSFIFAAEYPSFVKKLILIGSGTFEGKYASNIMETRLNRLNNEERAEAISLMAALNDPEKGDKNTLMAQFGELMSKADAYDPLPHSSEIIECQYEIYQRVWGEASKLRKCGELLSLGNKITCPVVAIHGDYDSHLPEGVKEPLSRVLKDFRFILLENCGHSPWLERNARERFYRILKAELE